MLELMFTGFLVLLPGLLQAQDTVKPATLKEIKETIDWSKVPKLDGAVKINHGLSICSYDAPGTFQQAADFFRKHLSAMGWTQDTTIPSEDQKQYFYVAFNKGGMHLGVHGSRGKPDGPMTISLMNYGNIDVRTFAKMPDAKVKGNYRTAVAYTSASKPEEVAEFCKKDLTAKGWRFSPNEMAAYYAKEGRTILRFICNAMEATIVIYKNKEGETEVTYTCTVQNELKQEDVAEVITGKSIAKPANTKEMLAVLDITKLPRLDKAQKDRHKEKLEAITTADGYLAPASVPEAVKFYRKLFTDRGWTEQRTEFEHETITALKFEKAGFLLSVAAIQDKDAGMTQIAITNHGNVDLRQLPYPEGAEIRPVRSEIMYCSSKLTEEQTIAFYRRELPKLGWKEDRTNVAGSLRFRQNNCRLKFEIGKDSYDNTAIHVTTSIMPGTSDD